MQRIPATIHQIWIGPKPRPASLMATWQRMNPSFRYELWDDTRVAGFGFRNAQKIAEQPEWNGKADLMRYEILHRYGGVLIDADSECILPLPASMLDHDSFACWENEVAVPGLIAAGYVGATAGNRLMRLCIEECARRDMGSARAWITVGPGLLTAVARGFASAADAPSTAYPDLFVYPSHTFIPEHPSGQKYEGSEPVYARQFWGSTYDSYEELAKKMPSLSVTTHESDPLVSVVIPCFKQAQYLSKSIRSVIDQTYKNWEIVVVNDGSPDDTSAVVTRFAKAYTDLAIHLVEKKNGGLAEARNVGIIVAKGRLILPLDADDAIHPKFLERTVAAMVGTTNVVYANLREFGSRDLAWAPQFSRETLLRENCLPYASLFRKELWERVGGYDPSLPWGYEDWNFWLACLSFGLDVQHIPTEMFFYRVKSESMLSQARRHHDEVVACIKTLHPSLYPVAEVREAHLAIASMDSDTLTEIDRPIRQNRPMSYLWRGLVRERHGLPESARRDFDRCLELSPGNWQATERLPKEKVVVSERVFEQTWWQQNIDTKMPEFRGWIGDHTAESKVFCRKYIASKGHKSILDCGCGVCTEFYGYKSDGYEIEYHGVDATPKLVSIGLQNGIDVVHGYLESLPQPDASVDVCYIRHILEHLPHYGAAIHEAMRVAAKEVLIVWFIKPSDGESINHDPGTNLFHNRYDRDGIVAHAKSHARFKSLEWIEINEKECALSIRLAEPVQLAEPVRPAEPIQPADPFRPAESVQFTWKVLGPPFWTDFVKPGALVFDVGANVGAKCDAFLEHGANVIAIEPQPGCVSFLRQKYANYHRVVIVPKGMSDHVGSEEMSICSVAPTISTLASHWKTGRFANYQWDGRATIEVTTLDEMLREFGVPQYIKIDVEGYELQVLKGLSQSVPLLSFEFAYEFLSDARHCLEHLASLGYRRFNVAVGENDRFIFRDWISADEVIGFITASGDPGIWGDIYAIAEPIERARKPKIALLTIATNGYTNFVESLYESVEKHFLADHNIDIFLFTNQAETMRARLVPMNSHRISLHVVPLEHRAWPNMTLRRFHVFQQVPLDTYDYVFYSDVDMRFVDTVGEEILGDLVATLHPGFFDKPRDQLTYEYRPESTAYVAPHEGTQYFAGGFQGGGRGYLNAIRAISASIDEDTRRGITAIWNDESHWNRYLIDHPPTVVLSPSYCYPESYRLPFVRRLLALVKDHDALRAP